MIQLNSYLKFSPNYRDSLILIISFLACALLFTFRNLDPLLFPTLYAEDGVWLGLLMQNGFLDTAFHARQGFPVFGLVALDWVALQLNLLFSSGQLFDLPFYIWIVSITFLSAVSIFPYIAFRNILPLRYRFILIFILPLMPVGAGGNEIFGRIGNLVFLFPLICIYSICLLRTSTTGLIPYIFALIIIFISGLTFPVCLGILLFWCMFEILLRISNKCQFSWSNYFEGLEPLNWSRIILLGFILILSIILMPSNLFSFEGGGANLSTNPDGWIDYVGARLVLYPIISSFYSSMNNVSTIFGCILVVMLLGYGLLVKNDGKTRFIIFFLIISLFLYFASTAIMRSGFTSLFGQYKNSFPDRYFLGINVLFLVTLCFTVQKIPRFRRVIFSSILMIFILNVFVLHKRVFEGSSPVMNWREFGDLRHMTCSIATNNVPKNSHYLNNLVATYKDNLVEFPIYPKVENLDWRMTVPKSIFLHSIEFGCFGYPAVIKKY
jgi:hypothetical protein